MTFPRRGNLFSTVWNDFIRFFHSVEKYPQSCSIVWKIRPKFFHCVERFGLFFPRCGKGRGLDAVGMGGMVV